MRVISHEPESCASANSATSANCLNSIALRKCFVNLFLIFRIIFFDAQMTQYYDRLTITMVLKKKITQTLKFKRQTADIEYDEIEVVF